MPTCSPSSPWNNSPATSLSGRSDENADDQPRGTEFPVHSGGAWPWCGGTALVDPHPQWWSARAALYLTCVWIFAVVGRGTPGPWDAPRHLVAVGPYRWVRNPIYLAALLVVLGEAWLFDSRSLLLYAGEMAIFFHLFVIGYEEPTLRRAFGQTYVEYTRRVRRWFPVPVRHN